MNESDQLDFVVAERRRIQVEYQRREREVHPNLYASWEPASQFMIEGRNRTAEQMLRAANVFPRATSNCLEVGFGSHGWLSELRSWGVPETGLHGIELDATRAAKAQAQFPQADLQVGDAVTLPWIDGSFELVIASTLFTSILDQNVRALVARQIVRVLAPNGALVWYDFAFDNPRNPNVRGIKREELQHLFPRLSGEVKSVTLAPPLTRLVAPRSRPVASLLERIPWLRTHLLAVLVKHSTAA
jgi:ubiquinone/menaquinone biosynthesis C-methylase UbiE